ncbi:MAG TPA: L-threonine 3-dehydrogenase [Candidatus Bathyarchaeia archaeon]
MKQQMHSVVKASPGPGATYKDWPVPNPGPREILVHVEATSICGTDMQIYDWHDWVRDRVKPPFVIGHEFAGKVLEAGKEVSDIREGDIVSGETHIACGKCYQCRTGNAHICERMKLRGVDTDGCFSEYHSLPEQSAWLNDRKIPVEIASAQEPLGNAVHAASATDISGKTVSIFGCGPIGCCLIGLCKSYGATRIFAVDIVDYRLKLAKDMGADTIIDGKSNHVEDEILKATDGRGVDVFFEMSGAPPSFGQGFKTLKSGGTAVFFGLPSKPIEVDVAKWIVFKDARVRGVFGRRLFSTWYQTAEVLKARMVDLSKVITHRFELEEFTKAFALMKSGRCGKIIMYPGNRRGSKGF